MKLTPVKSYVARYPEKAEVDLNQLLLKNRPNRWKTSGTALLLLGALATSQLTACSPPNSQKPAGEPDVSPSSARKMNMAPIFEGVQSVEPELTKTQGSISRLSFQKQKADIILLGNFPGPEDMTPLTEEAALAIIKETLEGHGLSSAPTDKKVDVSDNTWSFDLEISGANEPIYAEFLTTAHSETESELAERESLNLSEDSKEAAVTLREKLSDVYDESTGVIFYDTNIGFYTQTTLRAQVNEFAEWLKTMGLI